MIEFPNGTILVQDVSELPRLEPRRLFLDFETSSGDKDKKSTNPWRDCYVAGAAVTCDDERRAWYVPVGHHYATGNLPWDPVAAWLRMLLLSAEEWVNSNVKYDAHVALLADIVTFDELCGLRLMATDVLGRIIDSDKHKYGLESLANDWLHEDISAHWQALQPYLGKKNKDYGWVPADVMAPYAGQDVLTNRRVIKYEEQHVHEQCAAVWQTEVELTTVLVDMEREGLRVDPQQVLVKQFLTMNRMLELEEQLAKQVGRLFRPHVNDDCFEVLCGQYGMPVLGWTGDEPGEGNPSFDKHVLAQYMAHPYAPHDVIEKMFEYRHLNTLNGTFLSVFLAEHVDGVLHSDYNQSVRTARMSCRRPNAQQQSEESKKLILPPPGMAIASWDQSQIEFRTIVHYIQNQAAIDAYHLDPDTDFHEWVALMTGMHRKPAKNVNFMMGFGGGRQKTVAMLASNMDVVGQLKDAVEEMVRAGQIVEEQRTAAFEMLCERRGEAVYNTYHRTLPELKRTAYQASVALKQKGYVYNLRGRHRHLPKWAAHKAFNNLNQSSAADLMKEQTVRMWQACRGTPIRLAGSVHDETVMHVPLDVVTDPRYERDVTAILEATDVDLRVPLRVGFGWSADNWQRAGVKVKDGGNQRPATRETAGASELDWLKVTSGCRMPCSDHVPAGT